MTSLYDGFINKYPVSKTLRFELIPQGETLEYLKANCVINNDEQRSEDYKKLKLLLDEYYKEYIEKALSDVELKNLKEYESLYNIKEKSTDEKDEFKKTQEKLRKEIVSFLKADKKNYDSLFKRDIIKDKSEFVKFLEGREEELKITS